MVSAAGLAGAVLLPAAWLLYRYHRYEDGDLGAADPQSTALYVVGSVLLAYHALGLRDLPFIILSVALVMFAATELGLLFAVRRGGTQ
ncbi:MAG: hypothetical protein ABEI97_03820 [Candidatus Nanohaloarchaea archaeon]